jgi:hypothetical protein
MPPFHTRMGSPPDASRSLGESGAYLGEAHTQAQIPQARAEAARLHRRANIHDRGRDRCNHGPAADADVLPLSCALCLSAIPDGRCIPCLRCGDSRRRGVPGLCHGVDWKRGVPCIGDGAIASRPFTLNGRSSSTSPTRCFGAVPRIGRERHLRLPP